MTKKKVNWGRVAGLSLNGSVTVVLLSDVYIRQGWIGIGGFFATATLMVSVAGAFVRVGP